jgi:hypothetical protein
LGGGITIENVRPVFLALALNTPLSIHHWPTQAQIVEAHRLYRSGLAWEGNFDFSIEARLRLWRDASLGALAVGTSWRCSEYLEG